MSKCTICGKPITLYPSAAERARKYGGVPSDYTSLLTEHSQCLIDKRNEETLDIIRRGAFVMSNEDTDAARIARYIRNELDKAASKSKP